MSNDFDIKGIGKEVLALEAEALNALGASIGDTFEQAVKAVLEVSGHVILVGIGKSGHVGCKIAASFSSTGTPSFFLHPSEAGHGDLGSVTKDSLVIGLSNSGKSTEVGDVLNYANGLGCVTVSITSSARSHVARLSDHALVLPEFKEACPNGLAPTTSTTMTIALGDALCVAVMKMRGFSADDFGRRHPAGKLGFMLKPVSEYLELQQSTLVTVEEDSDMSEVILAITEGGIGCVAVSARSKITGIITDGDIRRSMSNNIMSLKARDIMTENPITVSDTAIVREVVALLNTRKIGSILVLDGEALAGIVDLKTLISTGYV